MPTPRHLRLLTLCLTSFLLTSCQKSYNAYLGQWFQLYNYDTFSISKNGDSLTFMYKGSQFTVNTDHDVPSVNIPYLGELALILSQDGSRLNFSKFDFTKDMNTASESYQNAAHDYAQSVIGEIYKLEMGSTINFMNGNDCAASQYFGLSKGFMDASAPASVQSCRYTWNRGTRTATVDIQLPFGKSASFQSSDLFDQKDSAVLAGRWRFHNDQGEVILDFYDGSAGSDGLIGTVHYEGQYQCDANLHLVRRDGYSFQMTQEHRTGPSCPDFGRQTWISAYPSKEAKTKYTYIAADVPVPTSGQFGLLTSGIHLGRGFGYVGTASERPTVSASTSASSAVPTIPAGTPAASSPSASAAPSASTPTVTASAPATPRAALTLVRPLADPVASGMPRLYDVATTMDGGDGKTCALIDPGNPTKHCKVNVQSSGQYAWGSSWCAASAPALNNFLNHATLRYELDGQPIAVSQFWEGRSSTCLKRRLIVQNIPGGEQHELKLTITLDQDLVDGESKYPAGEYGLILDAGAN